MATQPIPTPTPVDMFGPDGQVHEVNPNDVQAALSSGGELAHQLKGPDGQIHYVRHSQLGDALRAGGTPVAAIQQSVTSPTKPDQPGFFTRLGQSFGVPTSMADLKQGQSNEESLPLLQRALPHMPGSSPSVGDTIAQTVLGPIAPMAKSYTQTAYKGIKGGFQEAGEAGQQAGSGEISIGQAAGKTGFAALKGGLSAVPVIGPSIQTAGEDIGSGNYAGGAGGLSGVIAQLALAKGASGSPKPATLSDAASTITDAVNPPPKSMSSFESSIQEHLPKAIQTAREQGLPITGRMDLAKAFTAAAEKNKATYYNDMLGPVKDAAIDTSAIRGYSGPTTYYNTATLGQLDARLAEINSTLSPAFEKGGASARAAITAENRSSLNAEAAAIRNRLYQEISTRTGIDQDAIASTKSSMGSMYNIADKITTAVNKERFAANQSAAGANPPHSVGEAVIRFSNKAFRNTFNDPDNAVANVVRRTQ